jgi:hypothetical protein
MGGGGDIPAYGGMLFKMKSNIGFFISEKVIIQLLVFFTDVIYTRSF